MSIISAIYTQIVAYISTNLSVCINISFIDNLHLHSFSNIWSLWLFIITVIDNNTDVYNNFFTPLLMVVIKFHIDWVECVFYRAECWRLRKFCLYIVSTLKIYLNFFSLSVLLRKIPAQRMHEETNKISHTVERAIKTQK